MDPGAPAPPPQVLPAERYLVVPRLGREQAEPRIVAEICDGAFRPPDARVATTIEGLYALFVPFWRIDIRRWDEAQRVTEERVGYMGVPVGMGPGDATTGWMVCAQSTFPYELKHPQSMIPSESRPILLDIHSLRQGDPDPNYGWEVVAADVNEATARAFATSSYRKLSLDANNPFAQTEVGVAFVHFVHYPVWFARYRYRAETAPSRDGFFHVAISAVDETCIAALHPSKLMAGAARIKKLFGFNG